MVGDGAGCLGGVNAGRCGMVVMVEFQDLQMKHINMDIFSHIFDNFFTHLIYIET